MVLVQRSTAHNQINNNSSLTSLETSFLHKVNTCHTSQFRLNNMIKDTKQIILTKVLIKPKQMKSLMVMKKVKMNVHKSE